MLRADRGYGFLLALNSCGLWLMINGRMFTFSRSAHSGRWRFDSWDNIWRKTKTAVVYANR